MLDGLRPAPNPQRIKIEGVSQCLFVHSIPMKRRLYDARSKTSVKALAIDRRTGQDPQMGVSDFFKNK